MAEIQGLFSIDSWIFNNEQDTVAFRAKYAFSKLRQIQSNKATGFDNISPKFLKIAANNLCYTLTPIINYYNIFRTSTYPDSNKHAEVTPLYKKSDHLAKENYRPLSVLSSTSKIFEGVMCDQLLKHVSCSLSLGLS